MRKCVKILDLKKYEILILLRRCLCRYQKIEPVRPPGKDASMVQTTV